MIIPLLIIAWLMLLLSPFIGFTFTDAIDSLFPGLIVVTLVELVRREWKRPYPNWWVRRATVALFVVTVLAPVIPLASYYLLSCRGMQVLGHWPRPMADDPKIICEGDPLYQRLYHIADYAEACGGWLLYTNFALAIHLRRNLSRKTWLWAIALFWIVWIIFANDSRFSWWLD